MQNALCWMFYSLPKKKSLSIKELDINTLTPASSSNSIFPLTRLPCTENRLPHSIFHIAKLHFLFQFSAIHAIFFAWGKRHGDNPGDFYPFEVIFICDIGLDRPTFWHPVSTKTIWLFVGTIAYICGVWQLFVEGVWSSEILTIFIWRKRKLTKTISSWLSFGYTHSADFSALQPSVWSPAKPLSHPTTIRLTVMTLILLHNRNTFWLYIIWFEKKKEHTFTTHPYKATLEMTFTNFTFETEHQTWVNSNFPVPCPYFGIIFDCQSR